MLVRLADDQHASRHCQLAQIHPGREVMAWGRLLALDEVHGRLQANDLFARRQRRLSDLRRGIIGRYQHHVAPSGLMSCWRLYGLSGPGR